MRIYLHIGLEHCGADRIQDVLADKRDQLASKGTLVPISAGRRNHTRLFMAVSDPDHVDPLRAARGAGSAAEQEALRDSLAHELGAEIARYQPDRMILSAEQLGSSLFRPSELKRLRDLLAPMSDEIRVVAHVDEQARVMARHYAAQLFLGRTASLEREVELAQSGESWRDACLEQWEDIGFDPARSRAAEVLAPPFWLDYAALLHAWEDAFGEGSVTLRAYDPALFSSETLTRELRDAFDLPGNIGKAVAAPLPAQPSAAWLARARLLNHDLSKLVDKGRIIPRKLWRRLMGEIEVGGPPIDPGSLGDLSSIFAETNRALVAEFPDLKRALKPDKERAPWEEAEPRMGFRSSQYVAAFLPRIDAITRRRADLPAEAANGTAANEATPALSPLLPPHAKTNYIRLKNGPFAPHNRLGSVNEEELAAAYEPVEPRALPKGNSGNLIVACMKNEGPYILEWVAYHRAIGVDNFLIYTNGCEDGTDEILGRLAELGIVQHRNNDDWKGKSPQQYALNQSLNEPVVRNAEWIIHIDVDEFMNIRCGNGTLTDFFNAIPDATNVAMTWRLFGNNGVKEFRDELVIEQFDTCAPKFCPKPHTAWGFKTMLRNIGAYQKLSCHRPNKLKDDMREAVTWVNGSGIPMKDVLDNGWRSSKGSIGYDLIQLNHYPLRSADSFLIKRQRGRALHVNRSIGLNYWVRMDWSYYRDVTIKRNIPRTKIELSRLRKDPAIARLHDAAVAWHRERAASLRSQPEFRDLYDQAVATRLTELERVAFALALEVDN